MTAVQGDIAAGHWASALDKLATLHASLPNDVTVTKFEAEALINTGQASRAASLLAPLLATEPDDAQALALLAHAQAVQKQWPALQATLTTLRRLHDIGRTPLNQVPLGQEPLPNIGQVQWIYYLAPSWSRYNVYTMARLLGMDGTVRERITLESGDGDQLLFTKQHPTEAAKGLREFSLDAYVNTAPETQTHSTYGFFTGEPTFETFRDQVLAIAAGTVKPISSRSGLTVPPSQ